MTPLQVEVLEEFAAAQKLARPQHEVDVRDRVARNEATHRRRKPYDAKYNKSEKAKAAQARYMEKLKADPERYAAYKLRRKEWRQKRCA